MKFTIDAAELHAALKGHVAPKNSPQPMLACVVLEAKRSQVEIRSSDVTSSLHSETAAAVADDGAVCVDYVRFAGLLSTLSDQITCTARDGVMSVSSRGRRGTYRLETMPADQHPNASKPNWPGEPVAVTTALHRAISEVQYAMAKQDIRHFILGVAISHGHAVATDGHRMAVSPLPEALNGLPEVIIHRDGVGTLMDILRLDDAQICIETGSDGFGRSVHAGAGSRYIATQALMHRFPDWRNVAYPCRWVGEISVDGTALKEALARFLTLAGREDAAVGLELTASTDGLHIQDVQQRMFDELIPPAESASGVWSRDPASIVIDARYLAATVSQGKGEFIWSANDDRGVQQFRFASSPTRHYIMPRRD